MRAQCGNMDDPECLTSEERSTWGAQLTPSASPQAASAPVQPRLQAQPGDAAPQGRRTMGATAVGLITGVALLAACVVGARLPVSAACCVAPVWLTPKQPYSLDSDIMVTVCNEGFCTSKCDERVVRGVQCCWHCWQCGGGG